MQHSVRAPILVLLLAASPALAWTASAQGAPVGAVPAHAAPAQRAPAQTALQTLPSGVAPEAAPVGTAPVEAAPFARPPGAVPVAAGSAPFAPGLPTAGPTASPGQAASTPSARYSPTPSEGAPANNPLQPSASWEDIRPTLIGDAPDPAIDPAQLLLEAPVRADDPALVPIRITQPPGAVPVERLALVIDENPAPVAATFAFGEALAPLDLEVRVRVNAYSDVRAVAWLKDGRQVMAGRFVKASGGCAAPASKDPAAALAEMGRMRLKTTPGPDGRTEATLMIRHPNNSGLQRDQVTLLNVPAMFIQTLEVTQGGKPWLTMDAGISISEDPVFRFAVRPEGTGAVAVHAEDTDGHVFDRSLPLAVPNG